MTLGEKFIDSTSFITYMANTFNIVIDDKTLETFFNNNVDMRFSYTGLLKSIKSL